MTTVVIDAVTVHQGGARQLCSAIAEGALTCADVTVLCADQEMAEMLPLAARCEVIEGPLLRRVRAVQRIVHRIPSPAMFVGVANRRVPAARVSESMTVVQNEIYAEAARHLVMRPFAVAVRGAALRWSLRSSAHIVAVAGHLTSRATAVIANGVDDAWNTHEFGSAAPIDDAPIIYASQVIPYKNQLILLEGFRRARVAGLPNGLLLVGDVLDPAYFGRLPLSCLPDARHIPHVGPSELRALIARSQGVVYPSLKEASPVAVYEAQASGLPLAVSDIEAHRILARPSDLLFDPLDADAIAKALIWLGSQARRHRQRIRTWSDVASDYARLFQGALSRC